MSPFFMEGDYVLSVTSKLTKLDVGDSIIFKSDIHGCLLKKISQINEYGYFVEGTHPLSTDSHSLGLIPPKMVVGKVIMHFPSRKK